MKIIGVVLMFMMNMMASDNKSVYIWSKEFNQVQNNFIIQFLKKENINIALISASKNSDLDKLKIFIQEARQNNIKIEFLIGNNNWIYPDKRDKIDEKLNSLSQFDNFYIHLDIEPQAILSLKHDREKYLQMYIDMLKYIHSNFPKYKISISIPTFYPMEYVEEMSKYVDNIYLMAYEYKKLSQLQKRVEKYKSLKSKIVVAFNCKDFTKETLENDVKFIRHLGYKNIAFHSFLTLKELYETK